VLYMSATLPVNLAGLALIGLAVALFITDVFAPTHGILTGGGIISFFLGALMLFDRTDPAFRLSLAYIIPATALTAAFFVFVVGAGLRAQFRPAQSGKETMLGKTVAAISRIDAGGGRVFIEGENWKAVSETPVESGQTVEVVGVEGSESSRRTPEHPYEPQLRREDVLDQSELRPAREADATVCPLDGRCGATPQAIGRTPSRAIAAVWCGRTRRRIVIAAHA